LDSFSQDDSFAALAIDAALRTFDESAFDDGPSDWRDPYAGAYPTPSAPTPSAHPDWDSHSPHAPFHTSVHSVHGPLHSSLHGAVSVHSSGGGFGAGSFFGLGGTDLQQQVENERLRARQVGGSTQQHNNNQHNSHIQQHNGHTQQHNSHTQQHNSNNSNPGDNHTGSNHSSSNQMSSNQMSNNYTSHNSAPAGMAPTGPMAGMGATAGAQSGGEVAPGVGVIGRPPVLGAGNTWGSSPLSLRPATSEYGASFLFGSLPDILLPSSGTPPALPPPHGVLSGGGAFGGAFGSTLFASSIDQQKPASPTGIGSSDPWERSAGLPVALGALSQRPSVNSHSVNSSTSQSAFGGSPFAFPMQPEAKDEEIE